MKIVINRCFGGFSLSHMVCDYLGIKSPYQYSNPTKKNRCNPALIEAVERFGREASDSFSAVAVVKIPDEATDFLINEYDGAESIYYVLNGKIVKLGDDYDEDEDEDFEDEDEDEDEDFEDEGEDY